FPPPPPLGTRARPMSRPPPLPAPPVLAPRRLERPAAAGRDRPRDLARRRERRPARPAVLRGRPLRPLHRGDDGSAERRPLAPRGRLLQRPRRAPARIQSTRDGGAAARPREPRHRWPLARVAAGHARGGAVERLPLGPSRRGGAV